MTKTLKLLLIYMLFCTVFSGCAHQAAVTKEKPAGSYTVFGKTYQPMKTVSEGFSENGKASWYGPGFDGRKTSSGDVYDMHKLTAAHKTLPLNTMVRVINLNNNREVLVRINDRGPFIDGRNIDLSLEAAKRLDMVRPGTAPVKVALVDGARPVLIAKAPIIRAKADKGPSPNPFFKGEKIAASGPKVGETGLGRRILAMIF
jgi:rare lipoprotein A